MPVALYLMLGGAAALAIGSFLPWVKIVAPLIGTVTKSGMEGSDGWFTLAGGVAVAVLGLAAVNGSRFSPRWAIGVSVLAGAVVAYEFADISHRFSSVDSSFVATSYGSGLYLCAVGAGAALIGSVMTADFADNRHEAASGLLPEQASGVVCPEGHENRVGARHCDTCGSKFLQLY